DRHGRGGMVAAAAGALLPPARELGVRRLGLEQASGVATAVDLHGDGPLLSPSRSGSSRGAGPVAGCPPLGLSRELLALGEAGAGRTLDEAGMREKRVVEAR